MSRLRKMFTFFSHAALAALLVYLLHQVIVHGTHSPRFNFDGTILALDGITLLIVGVLYQRLINTYTVILSRVISWEGMILGTVCSLVALFGGHASSVHLMGAGSALVWAYFGYSYYQNAALYVRQGAGPLPVGTCLRVPASALRPGDVIATSGMMAKLLRQSVGHTELVVPWQGGIMLLSSWFERGSCLTKATSICKDSEKNHYYVLRRRTPLSPEQCAKLEQAAVEMLADNAGYIERAKEKRAKLWSPIRTFLDWKFPVTGYDWVGKYSGRLAPDRWTCTGTYLEAMRRIGVSTIKLGRGIAGFGTGLFDFLNTEELRFDHDLVLVMESDLKEMGIEHDCDRDSAIMDGAKV